MKHIILCVCILVISSTVKAQKISDSLYLDTCSYICATYYYLKFFQLRSDNMYIIKDKLNHHHYSLNLMFKEKTNRSLDFDTIPRKDDLMGVGCQCFIDPITSFDSLDMIINWYYEVDSVYKEIDSIHKTMPKFIVPDSREDSIWTEFSMHKDFNGYRQHVGGQKPILIQYSSIYYLDEENIALPVTIGWDGSFRHGIFIIFLFKYHSGKQRWILEPIRF